MIPTPTNVLNIISPISEYLASNALSEGALYGAPENPVLAMQLYLETESLRFLYNYEGIAQGNLPSQSLLAATNYVYALCIPYALSALAMQGEGGVIPGTDSPNQRYGYPISGYYIGQFDGETDLILRDTVGDLLPQGAIVVQFFKSINWLEDENWNWSQPVLTLLNGNSLGDGEKASFLYVIPV